MNWNLVNKYIGSVFWHSIFNRKSELGNIPEKVVFVVPEVVAFFFFEIAEEFADVLLSDITKGILAESIQQPRADMEARDSALF